MEESEPSDDTLDATQEVETADTSKQQVPSAQRHSLLTPTATYRDEDLAKRHGAVVDGLSNRNCDDVKSIIRDDDKESDGDTANDFSNSLVDTIVNVATFRRNVDFCSGTEASWSACHSDKEIIRTTPHSLHQSSEAERNRSGDSDCLPSVTSYSGTTTQRSSIATATSSCDDRKSSRSIGSGGCTLGHESVHGGPGSSQARVASSLRVNADFNRLRRYGHHRRDRPLDDDSRLILENDEGSDQLSTGPTMVVASHLSSLDSPTVAGRLLDKGEGLGPFLLERHREPAYHTIRRTYHRMPQRDEDTTFDSSCRTLERNTKMTFSSETSSLNLKRNNSRSIVPRKRRKKDALKTQSDENDEIQAGNSSCSGTEDGYMGSADSKENESTTSISSSSDYAAKRKDPDRPQRCPSKILSVGHIQDTEVEDREIGDSSTLVIEDFSSGTAFENGDDSDERRRFAIKSLHAGSLSLSSSNEDASTSSESGYVQTYHDAKSSTVEEEHRGIKSRTDKGFPPFSSSAASTLALANSSSTGAPQRVSRQNTSITGIGCDVMAHVLTFLAPPTILDVLTMPLSKEWRKTFTSQADLWRVLCMVEPFKAEILDDDEADDRRDVKEKMDDDTSTTDSVYSLNRRLRQDRPTLLMRYRLLYTSFVRCMKYLTQIRDDALNGRAPSYIDYGVLGATTTCPGSHIGMKGSLRSILASANSWTYTGGTLPVESTSVEETQPIAARATRSPAAPVESREHKTDKCSAPLKPTKFKIGQSMITDRLLGPSSSGQPGSLALPWSCAVYSIVNWMISFSDVEGIQTLCLNTLPCLLENELQRQTAQRAGLTDVVLRAMVYFRESIKLHVAAFHTIVLLARPLGGREGMLFHSSMVMTGGIFGEQNDNLPESGISIMIKSMKRFRDCEALQAMSCWALVNIALTPSQKAELVKLGGIRVTIDAMKLHPFSAEVQFRALFALVNLVIPSGRLNREDAGPTELTQGINDGTDSSEKEIIDESVMDIATMVVQAMKNFCSSEAILNRACLVLHNLSLSPEYHSMILFSPNCFQMLEWSLANYRNDQVLQQSAFGTLQRLRVTLSHDKDLRAKFTKELHCQQQAILHQAHQEAIRLQRRQEDLILYKQQAPKRTQNPM